MAGIYVHIPFCKSRCVYCAFYSVVCRREKSSDGHRDELMGRYISVLTKEIQLKKDMYSDFEFNTIYFGGGTPSLLNVSELEFVINTIKENCKVGRVSEFTIEANPEQLSFDYCRQLKQLGVNRLSIGVQSFDGDTLKFLGRRHSPEDAFKAVDNAKKAGFENISIDLIYGINERSDSIWKEELENARQLEMNHFSAYALTLEENSILYKRVKANRHESLDEGLAKRQYDILAGFSAKNGFLHYEVSNFAKGGYESRHNSSYWFGVPYAGFGVAAHSFDGRMRMWNASNMNDYFTDIENGRRFSGQEKLSEYDKFNEYVLLRLRTAKGINLFEASELFGAKKVEYLQTCFRDGVDRRHFEADGSSIRLTQEGLWFADGIASAIFLTE